MPARGHGHNTASPVRRAQAKNDAAQLRSETEKRRQSEERLNLAKAHREERRRLEEEWKRKLEALDEYCRAKIRVLAEARSPLRATISTTRVAVSSLLRVGTQVHEVARYDLERAQQIDRRRGSRFKPSSRLLMLKEDKRRLVQTRRFSEAVRDAARDSCQNARMVPPAHKCQYPRVITDIHRTRYTDRSPPRGVMPRAISSRVLNACVGARRPYPARSSSRSWPGRSRRFGSRRRHAAPCRH